MQRIIIRDDDTSFYTTPHLLERVYGRLWDAGIPVSLAVIPAVRGDTRVLHRQGTPFDPGIPPVYRGDTTAHFIEENTELCVYLNDKVAAGLVEICQHGYNHIYHEFDSDDPAAISHMLADGRVHLEAAFPTAQIKTFIAPYDRISATALQMIFDADYAVCTLPETLTPFPEYVIRGGYQQFTTPAGNPLYTAEEYLFNHRDDPAQITRTARQHLQTRSLLVLVNHYWTFYYDWGDTTGLYTAWDAFVDDLLALPPGTITTFAG